MLCFRFTRCKRWVFKVVGTWGEAAAGCPSSSYGHWWRWVDLKPWDFWLGPEQLQVWMEPLASWAICELCVSFLQPLSLA